jgi:hypothetical protein
MEPPPGSGSLNPKTGRYESGECYWDGRTWRRIDDQKHKKPHKWPLTTPQSVVAGAALVSVLLLGVALGNADNNENSTRAIQTTTRTLPPSPPGGSAPSGAERATTVPTVSPSPAAAVTTDPNAAAIEANRVAMDSQQAAADAQATRLDRQTYPAIGEREFGVLVRDPDAERGRRVVVYGYVTQFDSVTGTSMFRADTSAVEGNQWYEFDHNTIVNFDPVIGREIIDGDVVTLYAEVAGSRSYETTLGTSETALVLKANMIDITG